MAPVATSDAISRAKGALPELQERALGSEILFNGLLYPNRSLPNRGFWAVMALIIAVNLLSAIAYFLIGAWPVIFFCGLDVLLVWGAFKISYRQGRLHERVVVTPDNIFVSRVLPSGHESQWVLQPYWTRVHIARPVKHESQLRLISHGKQLILGAFLSPKERGELADALEQALANARVS